MQCNERNRQEVSQVRKRHSSAHKNIIMLHNGNGMFCFVVVFPRSFPPFRSVNSSVGYFCSSKTKQNISTCPFRLITFIFI